MGRYFSGDIEGKFWFGIQSSDDASFFGGDEVPPNFIEYHFDKSDLPRIKNGIQACHDSLGDNQKVLHDYFEKHDGYIDAELAKHLGVTEPRLNELLTWYARLELGEKIEKCVTEKGECRFEAEL